MTNLTRLGLGKVFLNLALDFKSLGVRQLSIGQRVTYLFRKYACILSDRRRIKFMRHAFAYDNRLTPALLPRYVTEVADLLSSIDRPVHTVFDIGANVGQFAYVLKSLRPKVKIFSFEPNPTAFALLETNSRQFADWACFPFGIGTANARVPFYFVDGKSAQGSIHPENATQGLLTSASREIGIEVKALDDSTIREMALPTVVDLIKIDVEGAEIEVLEALSGVRWSYLYIELSEDRAGGVGLDRALAALRQRTDHSIQVLEATRPEGPGRTYQALLQNY